ncbi:hypothetical protein TNCV_4750461 [Trichonephila clavipes]|nr:hypothetical protein TNCV_4750461 [Trichonephila clavipes]
MVIRSEGAVEYVMVGVSRRPTQAIWRGKEIEPVQDMDRIGINFKNGIPPEGRAPSKTTALKKGTSENN